MGIKAHTLRFWKICFSKNAQYLANKKQIPIVNTLNKNFEQYFMLNALYLCLYFKLATLTTNLHWKSCPSGASTGTTQWELY